LCICVTSTQFHVGLQRHFEKRAALIYARGKVNFGPCRPIVTVFRVEDLWNSVPPEYWYPLTGLHNIVQKIIIQNFIAVKASYLKM
jgi:hypothetical protein